MTLYAAPTSGGTAALACYGPRGADTPPAACSQAAAGMRILGEHPYDPALGAAWRGNVRSAMTTLAGRVRGPRSTLSRAQRAGTRAASARRLAAAYGSARAAIDRGGVPPQAATPHEAIVTALRALDADYGRLARAASRPNGSQYQRLQRAIAGNERSLRAELRGI